MRQVRAHRQGTATVTACDQIFGDTAIPACISILSATPNVPPGACDPALTVCPCASYCDPATSTCTPQRPQGGDCDDDVECGPNLFCSDMHKCAPRGGVGAPCGIDHVVMYGTCAPEGSRTACGGDDACAPDLYCQRTGGALNGTCAPRLADGAACARLWSCGANSNCDLQGGNTCKALLPDGAPCGSPSDCQHTCVLDPTTNSPVCGSTAVCVTRKNL